MSRRRKNFGEGYGFTFHGAFTDKKDAEKKEAKTPGSFIQGKPTSRGYRWFVMKPRTNPRKAKRQVLIEGKKFRGWASAMRHAKKQAARLFNPVMIVVREVDGAELRHVVEPPVEKNPTKLHKSFGKRVRAEKVYAFAGKMRDKYPGRKIDVQERSDGGWDVYVLNQPAGSNPVRLGRAGNPAELLVMGANPTDDPWVLRAAAQLYPGKSVAELSAENDEISRVLQLAAVLKQESGETGRPNPLRRRNQFATALEEAAALAQIQSATRSHRKNVEFGEFEHGIFHPWTRRPRTRRKAAARKTSNPDRYSSLQARAAGASYQAPGLIRTKRQRRVAGMVRQARKHKYDWMESFGEDIRRRGLNPAAADLRASFVGRPADWVSIADEPHMPAGDYAQLGHLLALYVKPRAGGQVQQITSGTSKPAVVSDETARQIYFVGGDQDLSSALEKFGALERGAGIFELGEVRRIDYKQRKEHVPEPDVDEWRHEFGEETGVRPVLLYDRSRKRILLEGGAYEIRPEGIVN